MPELPEVETIRRGLEKSLRERSIKTAKVYRAKTLTGISPSEFERRLSGVKFKAFHRAAKHLLIEFADGQVLYVHLKMSGAFLICKKDEEIVKHTHVIFTLDDESELRFKDVRAFARMRLFDSLEDALQDQAIQNLAPEPLENSFKLETFKIKLKKLNTPIKSVLLSQDKVVSGVGNIYADESLFLSGILPNRKASSLKLTEVKKLYENIQQVIQNSIEAGGTSIRDYVDTKGNMGNYAVKLWVYGRKKENCIVCRTPLLFTRIAQRGTHYCPSCQK
jgi:formamidopyrimidine-DNA glycosylase